MKKPLSFLAHEDLQTNPLIDAAEAAVHFSKATQTFLAGMTRYGNEFWIPYLLSTTYFQQAEADKLSRWNPGELFGAYTGLARFNADLMVRAMDGAMKSTQAYLQSEMGRVIAAVYATFLGGEGERLSTYAERQAQLMDLVMVRYPEAIRDIEPEYGFHFERGDHELVDETERFFLYRIAPNDPSATIRENGKPLLILPPYVLGANILGFLPGENRSYAHSFANQGVPTYIRILKDITANPSLQAMTGENDALDTRRFCEAITARHARPLTLNGYCQGGYSALCNLLSGELDGLVDAFITCVSPMDGTRSQGLSGFLKDLPPRFNDLAYGSKPLSSGNVVADGKLMGWVYKLKSVESESPLSAFFRDLMMFSRTNAAYPAISKTAAALNYWLNNERNDLPMEITRMSFDAYNRPITSDGTLPVKLFGRPLNLGRLKEMKIPWLICYGESDDLVEKETALAPLEHVEAEVTPFPKGHVAIATSWSSPDSACALHTRFGKGNWRGPVRFHLDLEAETAGASGTKAKSGRKRTPKKTTSPKSAATKSKGSSPRKTQTRKKKTPSSS
ncbi:MAG: metal transporter [Desulfobacteraceae bacterium]|nr:metal transporter [Desulfobacteraceae bacterium]